MTSLREHRLDDIAQSDEALVKTKLDIALQRNRIASETHLDGEQAALLLAAALRATLNGSIS